MIDQTNDSIHALIDNKLIGKARYTVKIDERYVRDSFCPGWVFTRTKKIFYALEHVTYSRSTVEVETIEKTQRRIRKVCRSCEYLPSCLKRAMDEIKENPQEVV